MVTFWPSMKPLSFRPPWNAGTNGQVGDALPRKPITGTAACCARAASGHAATPPTSDMNSRRLTASDSRASHRKDSTPRHGRLLNPSYWAERDDRDHAAEYFFQGGSP